MTIVIADNSPRKTYTATAGQTDFPTDFAFFAKADVNVYVNGDIKTLDSDYSIPTTGPSAWTSGNDGTVVFTTGLSAGDSVVLTRDVELERTTDFPSSGPFQVGSLNTELDKIIAMIADMEDLAERGLRLSDSDTSASLVLADKDSRKGTVLAFNSTTGAVEIGPTIADTQSIADIKADIAALADIEDGTLATDAISNLAAITSDVTTAASNITAIQNASANATTASTKATEAATSATAAAASATAAAASETAAETAETNAETAETNAATSATNAATSATSAASSATTATTKASEASTSATNAATSATSASTAQTAAETAQTAAETAQTAAETAETNAETAQTAAETAKTAAETAETNAATSETNAATSATTATTKASEAATSATNAASSATSAASAQTAAESARDSALASFDSFDDRYLGTKTSDPTVDNDGDALIAGALYFNSTDGEMKVYNGTSWVEAYADGASLVSKSGDTMTGALVVNADLTVDTNTLHVDASSDKVSIGTTTGVRALTVNETGTSAIAHFESDQTSSKVYFHDANTSQTYSVAIGSVGDDMAFYAASGGNERMRLDSSGDVGIGTTSPTGNYTKTLHIHGSSSGASLHITDPTSGATASDGLEVFQYGNDGYIWERENGTLRFATNATERMRLDSSGNVLVGQTSADNTVAGVSARSDGRLFATRDSDQPAYFNRLTNDGTIIEMAKDSSLVGSIFSYNGFLGIGSTSGSDAYLLMGSNFVAPATSTGAARDNAIDLGSSSRRFNDLYVGGNIYVGGTGSANALSDYEEGTFTPALATGTATFPYAVYTKVGNIVTVTFSMSSFSNRTSSNDLVVTGLPFNSASSGNYISGAVMGRYVNSGGDSIVAYQAPNDTKLYFFTVNQNSNYASVDHNDLSSSSAFFYITHTYRSA